VNGIQPGTTLRVGTRLYIPQQANKPDIESNAYIRESITLFHFVILTLNRDDKGLSDNQCIRIRQFICFRNDICSRQSPAVFIYRPRSLRG
jgi:hypothetical protein